MSIVVLRFSNILVDVIYYLYMQVNSESRSLPKNITIALLQAERIKYNKLGTAFVPCL
jgi:hypothetical protein